MNIFTLGTLALSWIRGGSITGECGEHCGEYCGDSHQQQWRNRPTLHGLTSIHSASVREVNTVGECGEHCGETKRQQGSQHQEHGSALQDPTLYALHGSTSNYHSASGEHHCNLACYPHYIKE